MKCCVIGGAGFIGRHVVKLLVESGRDVIILDRRTQPTFESISNIKYISGDYGEREFLRNLISDMDEVIDLAYTTVPKTSFENPIYDIMSNLPQSVGLLQEAVSCNLRKIIVVSSGGTVYGIANSIPIKEEHQTNPISPYGITKLTIEKYALMFSELSNLPVTIVRPGNAYGNEQSAFLGQGFVATAIQSILLERTIDIFGKPGTIRDYIHVTDVARGILAALDFGKPGTAYNIGSGVGYNNLEVINEIKPLADAAGYKLNIHFLRFRKYDVPANILDCQKLTAVSGWQPKISFKQGISQVWETALTRFKSSVG
jgi:UDP-glucose 4-epimerase